MEAWRETGEGKGVGRDRKGREGNRTEQNCTEQNRTEQNREERSRRKEVRLALMEVLWGIRVGMGRERLGGEGRCTGQ